MTSKRRRILLVIGGLYHDFDYVRLQLLQQLARFPNFRVDIRHDYSDLMALSGAEGVISYTCGVLPDAEQTAALRAWVAKGGRWFALHGTNSALEIAADGQVHTPPLDPSLFDLLGSQFLAHPPIGRYRVKLGDRHALTHGIEPFFVEDEHYLQAHAPGNQVLLYSEFAGETPLFGGKIWQKERQQTCYLRAHGRGCVLYLTLGHARGRYDMAPLSDDYPFCERGAWIVPMFQTLIERGLAWLNQREPI